MYLIHNYQFLAYSAAMEGRREETVKALRDARAAVPDAMLLAMPGLDWSIGYLYDGMARFGLWDEIIAEPAPDPKLAGLTIGCLQARATALAAKGRIAEAKALLPELDRAIAAIPPIHAGPERRPAALRDRCPQGEGAHRARRRPARRGAACCARRSPRRTASPTTSLRTNSSRSATCSAPCCSTGKAAEAETVYREDLKRQPNNGWALHGLARALEAQRKDAKAVKAQFSEAWRHSDTEVTSSAF